MIFSSLVAQLPDTVPFDIGEAGATIIPHAVGNNTPDTYQAAFGNFLGSILSFVIVIAVIMVFLYLVWGAIEWITSAGDKGKLEKARNRMFQAVIGIIVLSGTLAFLMIIQQFLGICVLSISGKCTGTSSAPTELYRCLPINQCGPPTNSGVSVGNCSPHRVGYVNCRFRATP